MKKIVRRGLLSGLVAAAVTAGQLGVGLVGGAGAATVRQRPGISDSPLAAASVGATLRGIKELNYMPSAEAWTNVWTNWDPGQINVDDGIMASLGANTVRVIIEPSTFGFPNLNPVMVGRLDTVISMAAAHGLRVQLTLFDWFSNWSDLADSTAWIHSLISPFANSSDVAFIELKNEIDPTSGAQIAWARAELPVLRSVAGSIPITLSVRGNLSTAGLSQLVAEMGSVQPDFYDLHYYGLVGDAATTFADAEQAVAPYPLFIGESGFSTYSGAGNPPSPVLESKQDIFFRSVEGATADLGLAAAAPWTLYDLLPSAVPAGVSVAPSELYFGLLRSDGSAKPAFSAVQQFFATGTEPMVSNAGFEAEAGGVPTDWLPDNPGNGELGWDGGVSHSGVASVRISNTSGPNGAQPGYHTTVNTGVLTPGESFTATVWAQGAAATGQSVLAVAWFNANGAYLGNAQSPSLPGGTTGWTQLSVNATAPAGAAYAELHVQSYANSGTVWFDDATMARTGS